ncbi:MAG: hypothetical protein ACRDSR_16675 [Pseudonocardiaceae bacterium]
MSPVGGFSTQDRPCVELTEDFLWFLVDRPLVRAIEERPQLVQQRGCVVPYGFAHMIGFRVWAAVMPDLDSRIQFVESTLGREPLQLQPLPELIHPRDVAIPVALIPEFCLSEERGQVWQVTQPAGQQQTLADLHEAVGRHDDILPQGSARRKTAVSSRAISVSGSFSPILVTTLAITSTERIASINGDLSAVPDVIVVTTFDPTPAQRVHQRL